MYKVITAGFVALILTGCYQGTSVAVNEGRNETKGLERRVESFSAPDKFGVVCYQDVGRADNLSCVKVQ